MKTDGPLSMGFRVVRVFTCQIAGGGAGRKKAPSTIWGGCEGSCVKRAEKRGFQKMCRFLGGRNLAPAGRQDGPPPPKAAPSRRGTRLRTDCDRRAGGVAEPCDSVSKAKTYASGDEAGQMQARRSRGAERPAGADLSLATTRGRYGTEHSIDQRGEDRPRRAHGPQRRD